MVNQMSNTNQNFMKTRPILPLVLSMAYPMVISMLVNSLYNIIDSFYVAKISEDAMTALSLVFPAQNLVTAVTVGFAIGINAVIAYYLGMKKQNLANTAATVGMILNLFHGLALSVICIGFMKPFLEQFTNKESIVDMGISYSNVAFLFCIPIAVGISFEKIFQAVGQMKVSMISMMMGCIVNIVLDPMLIFGVGIFPRMGMEGAALATGIGQMTTLIIYVAIYLKTRKRMAVKITFSNMENIGMLVGKMYEIGIPATLNMALPSVMVSVLNGLLATYSAAYVLVLGAYYKLQTFLYLTANGIVQGMRPICSYNYGAGEYKRVKGILKVGLILITGVMVVGTILSLTVPSVLIGLFTENQETVRLGAVALRIISIGFVVSGVSVAISGTLEGLGKGKESLAISMTRYIVAILPLAFLLSHFVGANGVWHAFWITEIIGAALSVVLFACSMAGMTKK